MKFFAKVIATLIVASVCSMSLQAVKPVKKRAFVLPAAEVTHVTAADAANSTHIAGAVTGKKAALEMLEKAETKNIVPDMLSFARKHLGKRYVYGAMGPNAFDCSGFTSYVFKQFGYKLHRVAGGQMSQGTALKIDEAQPGDLIFFGPRSGGASIGHVGMVIEVNPTNHSLKFIHAANGGVQITNFPDGGYYSRRYKGVSRILSDEDRGE